VPLLECNYTGATFQLSSSQLLTGPEM